MYLPSSFWVSSPAAFFSSESTIGSCIQGITWRHMTVTWPTSPRETLISWTTREISSTVVQYSPSIQRAPRWMLWSESWHIWSLLTRFWSGFDHCEHDFDQGLHLRLILTQPDIFDQKCWSQLTWYWSHLTTPSKMTNSSTAKLFMFQTPLTPQWRKLIAPNTHLTDLMIPNTSSNLPTTFPFSLGYCWIASRTNASTSSAVPSSLSERKSSSCNKRGEIVKLAGGTCSLKI